MRVRRARAGLASVVLCGLLACSGGGADPVFPPDYADTYTEVRDCRQSGDHDLRVVRVLADPTALGPYTGRTDPFPEGAVVLKEEYAFGDVDCEGPIQQWTVMVKLAEGADPAHLDWYWERVDARGRVASDTSSRCVSCHSGCEPPDGYDFTCTVP